MRQDYPSRADPAKPLIGKCTYLIEQTRGGLQEGSGLPSAITVDDPDATNKAITTRARTRVFFTV